MWGRPDYIVDLLRTAIFSGPGASPWGYVELDTRLLGELLNMCQTHKMTLLHDKVFALLGMCSDDLKAANLLPDYSTP